MVVDVFVSKKRDIPSRSSWRSSVQCLKISTVTIHYIYFHFTTWYKIYCEKPVSNTSAQCRAKYSFLNLHIGPHNPDKKQHKKYQIIDSKQKPLLSETSKTTWKMQSDATPQSINFYPEMYRRGTIPKLEILSNAHAIKSHSNIITVSKASVSNLVHKKAVTLSFRCASSAHSVLSTARFTFWPSFSSCCAHPN